MLAKDDLERTLDRIHEWIRSADQKVSILLAFQGLLITFLLPGALDWLRGILPHAWTMTIVLLVAAAVLIPWGVFKAISALIPRLKTGRQEPSVIYFGDIAATTIVEYRRRLNETDDGEYGDEVVRQIHVGSKICFLKHAHFRDSVILFFTGLLILVVTYVTTYPYGN